MVHDFKKFPELTNSQMDIYYFESPHKQILDDFEAEVVKVHDGDTITLRTDFREFDFPLRFLDTNAPELNEDGGHEARDWLKSRIEGEKVEIKINPNQRVGKFGRLLGRVHHGGMDINDESMRMGFATSFENRREGQLPSMEKELAVRNWL